MGAGAWRVWVCDQARSALIEAAAEAHPNEIGGVLVGVIGHVDGGRGRPWVTHAVRVESHKRGRAHYELPARARELAINQMRKHDPRLGYLGDWHSHPINVAASGTDTSSVEAISVSGDCPRPLLFVIRRTNGTYAIDARQWTGASLRRLQVVGAGPLVRGREADRRRKLPSFRRKRGR